MAKGLDYIINIKDGDFGGASKAKSEMQGLDNAVEHTHGVLGGLKEMIGEVGTVLLEAFAVEKVIDFGKESYQVYEKTAQSKAQIMAGIKSTAGAAGLSLEELTEQAEKLAHTTLFSPAQTEQAQAIELSFTNIRGAIFNEALPAIENLATRMGGDGPADLKGAAVQVGKALQDPITGIVALHRVGVEFSDAQKDMIATDVKHGQIQKAQSIILKELQTEFGGSAEAARKVKGAMGDLDEQTEELKMGFGKMVNDGLQVVIPALLSTAHWIGENKELLIGIAEVVGGATAAYLLYEGTILALQAPMAIMTAAQWALDAAMDANPVGLIVVGIGALITGLVLAYQKSETFRAVLAGIGSVAEELVPIFKGLGEIILGALTFNPILVVEGFKDAYEGVKKVIDDGGIGGAFNKGFDASIASSHKDEAERKRKEEAEKKGTASDLVHHGGKATPFTISTGKRKRGGDDESTTLSGGRSVRNVQVTIGKLVERLEVHTTNLQGTSAVQIKKMLEELLVGTVHDSELALGSQ